MTQHFNIVVMLSGNGSNLQAIIDQIKLGYLSATIKAVISNNSNAYGVTRAKAEGIPCHIIDHHNYNDRSAYDEALIHLIDPYSPQLIVLTGFMRILTDHFVNHYLGRLINIHPSLLPKYPGLDTHQRALAAKDSQHGCTVHFVTPTLDSGPAIIQAATSICNRSTIDTLAEQVHYLEHAIYPLAIKWFSEGRLKLSQGKAYLDNLPLPKQGYYYEPIQANDC